MTPLLTAHCSVGVGVGGCVALGCSSILPSPIHVTVEGHRQCQVSISGENLVWICVGFTWHWMSGVR
jgi:hypothetical protein